MDDLAAAPSAASPNALVDKAVCLMLSFSRPGVKRKLRNDQYVARDAEKDLIGAQKKIIVSPEYDAVAAFEASIKGYLRAKALRSKIYRSGTYLIPIASLQTVDTYLETARAEWVKLVDAFVATYPERKAETMARLGEVAAEGDYPTIDQIRDAFAFDHEYVALSTPSTLKQVSAAMFAREEERFRERLQSAESEIVNALREQFAGLVEGMKEMLDGGTRDNGRAKTFAGGKIVRLQEFLAEFAAHDVCGDVEMKKLVGDASKLLSGVDPKALRADNEWRASMSASFGDMLGSLSTLVKPKGQRQIDVEADAS